LSKCAEEDSNLHPVIPDPALNLVTPLGGRRWPWASGASSPRRLNRSWTRRGAVSGWCQASFRFRSYGAW